MGLYYEILRKERDIDRDRDFHKALWVVTEKERESGELLCVLWASITQFSGKREKEMVRETERFTRHCGC